MFKQFIFRFILSQNVLMAYQFHINSNSSELESKYENVDVAYKEINPSKDYAGLIISNYNQKYIDSIFLFLLAFFLRYKVSLSKFINVKISLILLKILF